MKASILLTVSVSLLLAGCGGGDVTEPGPTTQDPPLAQGTVGPDGGWIGDDDVSLAVPAGALDQSTELKIFAESEGHPLAQDMSPVYRLEGLPEILDSPVTLRFRHTVHPDSAKVLLLGAERDGRSVGVELAWQATVCTDSSGWCIAELTEGAPDMGDKDIEALRTALASGLRPYTEPEAHYVVWYDPSVTTRDYVDWLLSVMEEAQTAIRSLGFNFGAQDTIWPLHAYMITPTNSLAAYYYGRCGKGFFQFSPVIESNEELTNAVVLHEVFHCAQQWFDPRPPEAWIRSNDQRKWLDEATASAIEMSAWQSLDRPGSMSSSNFTAPLAGLSGHPTLSDTQYGYGMSSFFDYVVTHQGSSRLLQCYEEFALSGDAVTALQNVLDPAPTNWIVGYHHDLVGCRIYHFGVNENPFWDLDHTTLTGDVGNWRRETLSVPDLGAALFAVQVDGAVGDDEADLMRVRVPGDYEISVWALGSEQHPACIATGSDSVTVDGLQTMGSEAERMLIMVSQPWTESADWDGATSPELDVELLGRPDLAALDEIRVEIGVLAHWDNDTDANFYSGCSNHTLAGPEGPVTLDGSTYLATWDHYNNDDHFVGEITIEFDLETLAIVSYEIDFEVSSTSGHYRSGHLTGGAIPLTAGDVGSGLDYELEGTAVCTSISSFASQYRFTSGSTLLTLESFGCDGESYLRIELEAD